MANNYEESYRGVDPGSFRKAGEADIIDVVPNEAIIERPPPKRGRNRRLGNGKDKLTMARIKSRMVAGWQSDLSYAEIADEINAEFELEGTQQVNRHQIAQHIKTLIETEKKTSLNNISEKNAMVLARLDQIEMLAQEAYFASMLGKTTKNVERQIKKAKSKDRQKQIEADFKRERARVKHLNEKNRKDHKALIPDPIAPYLGTGDLPDLLETTSENIKKFTRTESNPAGDPRFLTQILNIIEMRAKLWGLMNRSDITNGDQELARLPDDERTSRLQAVVHAALVRKTEDRGNLALPAPLGGFRENEVPVELHEVIEKVEPEAEELDVFDGLTDEAIDEAESLDSEVMLPDEDDWC